MAVCLLMISLPPHPQPLGLIRGRGETNPRRVSKDNLGCVAQVLQSGPSTEPTGASGDSATMQRGLGHPDQYV